MTFAFSRRMIEILVLCLAAASLNVSASLPPAFCQVQAGQIEPTLTEEEMRRFLLKARVVRYKQAVKGITRPYRLTLTDGKLTHDASFQSIDDRKNSETLDNGTVVINFRDSFHFNIAAYEIAKLVGLRHMMPVTVQRKWEGKTGSLTWWLNVKMDEQERLAKGIRSPDAEAWNRQMYRKRVFANLVGDLDPNLTNVLIGENWEIYMIDFTRAFRLLEEIEKRDLVQCDRQLLEKLRGLTAVAIERVVGNHLTRMEVNAVIKRRDKIVDYFEQLVAQKGESEVLY